MKKNKKVERIGIIVDDRERAVLNEELEKIGFEVKVKRLLVGDYVYKDIGFERKTIDDFCASIIDGRLKKQVEQLKKRFKWSFILINGRVSERKSDINENCVLGKIVSLIVKHKIGVIMVDNDKQMAYIIRRIVDRCGLEGQEGAIVE